MPNDTTATIPTTDHTSISHEGAELHCELRGAGEPLLLLHGFTGAGGDWKYLFDLDELAGRYRLIIPDARGHGRSTNLSGAFTHRQCADDVLALCDHLGVARCKAIGLSLGGNTLLHLATRDPGRLAAMVLIGAPSYFPAPARAIMRSFTPETRSAEDWAMMRARHVHGDEQIRALWRAAAGFADSYDDMTFTPPHLATIQARTLIVTGDRDPLYPLEIFVEQYRAIPDAALHVVPNAGHDAVFGPARPDFVRAALAFLQA
ncbi:MAG TPA: alpha/beta fold hydrolase [Polyangia bacterium]|jgi:pimeloyl-ACP methyl ester carboxylesterase